MRPDRPGHRGEGPGHRDRRGSVLVVDPLHGRVTDLFETWAAEEQEQTNAGESGIAEGLKVAIEGLRTAVRGAAPQPAADTGRGERLRAVLVCSTCDGVGLVGSNHKNAGPCPACLDLDRRLLAAGVQEEFGLLFAEVARLDAMVAAQAETITRLHDIGTGVVSHRHEGDCPVGPPFSPTKRDSACPACRALDGGAR